MDIYSSLFATLLGSVIATPILATTSPFIPHNDTVLASSPAKKTDSSVISALVNINTADEETLVVELKGIGLRRAKTILAYRAEHGPFKSIDDLVKIKGVSKKVVDQNRQKITV